MNKKITFATLILLAALLTQFAAAPLPVLAAACDAAQFVADVTVPDGTSYKTGDTFTKTWKLKNVGTCTWNGNYSLTFASGDQMGAPSPAPFPNQNVAPGQTVDLTVNMKAPNVSGTIYGYWKLKNASATPFGIGSTADKAFWVQIRVSTSGGGGTGYDFVKEVASAVWTNGAGTTLTFPGKIDDASGAGLKVDNAKLENGTNYGAPGLLMVPQNVYNGFVQAQYPVYHVQNGDHFQSIINCEYQATSCYVNFRLDYQIGSGAVQNFWTFNERYEGLYYPADRDLSSLAGQDVKFILRLGAAGYATGDRALWINPRITNIGGGSSPTKTPTVTATGTLATPTQTPSTGCSDRATFISDVDVPDGKVFAANTPFTKTWYIKNTGTCTWTTNYKLVFVSDNQMGGPAEQNLTSTVGPNTTLKELSVKLTSPAANGSYTGYWMFANASGKHFGIGSLADTPWWVKISVTGGGSLTVTPTPTGPTRTPTATPTGPAKTSTPNTGPDRATFMADVTVQDGTIFIPNTPFTKTWRIQNTGTSTWTIDYKLVFVSGDPMNGPGEMPLPSSVAPGKTIDVSVNLTSPAASGKYLGFWMLKNPAGQLFGIGSMANQPFWVAIAVTSTGVSTATPTPTATITNTPAPTNTPTITPTPSITLTPTLTPTETKPSTGG